LRANSQIGRAVNKKKKRQNNLRKKNSRIACQSDIFLPEIFLPILLLLLKPAVQKFRGKKIFLRSCARFSTRFGFDKKIVKVCC
jgi:hypothetical protein